MQGLFYWVVEKTPSDQHLWFMKCAGQLDESNEYEVSSRESSLTRWSRESKHPGVQNPYAFIGFLDPGVQNPYAFILASMSNA